MRHILTMQEFEQLVLFWSLKGQISEGKDMGTKGLGPCHHQVKRITVNSKDYRADITYTVMTEEEKAPWVEIDYTDVLNKKTHLSSFYIKETGLPILEKM